MSQWKIEKDDLIFTKKIGKGNFGEVYDGDYLGTRVAIKKLYFVNDELMQKYIEREMDTLTTLAHPNIVQFLGLSIDLDDIFIVTEYVPGGDLRMKLKDQSLDIPWSVRVDIARQLAAAMNYLHTRGLIHRDLKSPNLLVGDGWKIKVCDFGLARSIDEGGENPGNNAANMMTIVGTNEWMAPEVMLGMKYDVKCDVFSYAMLLWELITRDKPPQREVRDQFGFPAEDLRYRIPDDTPEELWQLLEDCSQWKSDDRPDFKDIIRMLAAIQEKYDDEGWPETSDRPKSGRTIAVVKEEDSSDGSPQPVKKSPRNGGGEKATTTAKKPATSLAVPSTSSGKKKTSTSTKKPAEKKPTEKKPTEKKTGTKQSTTVVVKKKPVKKKTSTTSTKKKKDTGSSSKTTTKKKVVKAK